MIIESDEEVAKRNRRNERAEIRRIFRLAQRSEQKRCYSIADLIQDRLRITDPRDLAEWISDAQRALRGYP